MKKYLILLLGMLILLGMRAIVFGSESIEIKKVVYKEDKLGWYINKLAICESRNNPNVINHNDGGSPSYGLLQFKLDTFKGYSRKLGLYKDTEDAEFMNLIMGKEDQLKLARAMLEDNWNNWSNWKNCAKKIGIDF